MDKSSQKKVTGRGGARVGAGRKKGSGIFKEATKVVRIPISRVNEVKALLFEAAKQVQIKKPEEAKIGLTPRHGVNAVNFNQLSPHLVCYPPANETQRIELPLFSHKVVAGFPSPADDYIAERLDLNDKLVRNKAATFFLVVQGDSMKNVGIRDGDTLIVDRSLEPKDGKIVIASLDGELTVKRLSMKSTGTWLVPENDDYPPILVREESDITIWGVVTATITEF